MKKPNIFDSIALRITEHPPKPPHYGMYGGYVVLDVVQIEGNVHALPVTVRGPDFHSEAGHLRDVVVRALVTETASRGGSMSYGWEVGIYSMCSGPMHPHTVREVAAWNKTLSKIQRAYDKAAEEIRPQTFGQFALLMMKAMGIKQYLLNRETAGGWHLGNSLVSDVDNAIDKVARECRKAAGKSTDLSEAA